MEDANTLIRTVVRTFFPDHPRQILTIDSLLYHKELNIDDLCVLLNSQAKEIRSSLNILRAARLLTITTRAEAKVGVLPVRGIQREHYYIDYRKTIDAIKFRMMRLRKKVEATYALDETKRKDWRCPRCKAEYEELEVLDKINDQGFYCDRCGTTLVLNEAVQRDRGSHEKIRRLNEQLAKFDSLVLRVDQNLDLLPASIDEDKDALDRLIKSKIPVPYPETRKEPQYMVVKKDANREKVLEQVKVENLQVNLTSGAEHDREEMERAEERKRELAKQNMLPVWHTQSAIGMKDAAAAANTVKSERVLNGVKSEDGDVRGLGVGADGLKKEEDEDVKPNLAATGAVSAKPEMEDELDRYLAEMAQEAREAEERKREEEAAEEEEDDDDEADSDEADFEDVVPGNGTPVKTEGAKTDGTVADVKPPPTQAKIKTASIGLSGTVNGGGVKRNFDNEDESSDANTPLSVSVESSRGEVKRVKLEGQGDGSKEIPIATEVNGLPGNQDNPVNHPANAETAEDSEEDGDFEDAL